MATEPSRKRNLGEEYASHRAALAPLLTGAGADELLRSSEYARQSGEQRFVQFLIQQGLGSLWYDSITKLNANRALSPASIALLRQCKLHQTAHYLSQYRNAQIASEILNGAGIPHVFIKGVITRELYFHEPSSRPAIDIDILISPKDRTRVILEFEKRDFLFKGIAANISHECSLVKGSAKIDLHWDILRPGRTRLPVTGQLLEERVSYGEFWGPGHSANLFITLVHSVFTKYSTAPHATLVRLIDLLLILNQHPESVPEAETMLRRTGIKTAGWITATWLNWLTDSAAAMNLAETIKPQGLKRRYLSAWLRRNLSTRLLNKPALIQFGFTLPAHDTLADAWRVINKSLRCRMRSSAELAEIENDLLPLK